MPPTVVFAVLVDPYVSACQRRSLCVDGRVGRVPDDDQERVVCARLAVVLDCDLERITFDSVDRRSSLERRRCLCRIDRECRHRVAMELDLLEPVVELDLSFELGGVAGLDIEPCVGVVVKVITRKIPLPRLVLEYKEPRGLCMVLEGL